jgi:hypothetical protein
VLTVGHRLLVLVGPRSQVENREEGCIRRGELDLMDPNQRPGELSSPGEGV